MLFHGQENTFAALAIKDTIPYFLGAIQEDRLALEQALRRAKRDLSMAQKSLAEHEAIKGEGISRALGLLAEARDVGLIEAETGDSDLSANVAVLQGIQSWSPEQPTFVGTENITQVQQEIRELHQKLYDKKDEIDAVKSFAQEAQGFETEAQEQVFRLEAINFYPNSNASNHTCPLCSQDLQSATPSILEIRRSLERMSSNLASTSQEKPRLRDYINQLESQHSDLSQQIQQKLAELNGLIETNEAARQLRDLNVRRGKVVGRASLWLESVDLTDNATELTEKVEKAEERVRDLESQLSKTIQDDRLASIMNRINNQMAIWADELELEHSKNPIRLDLNKLTVFVDRADRPIPLSQIGSGKNWVGTHLITYLSLQKHFQTSKRPVPAFIFFDQPTKAFYPADRELSEEEKERLGVLEDTDRQSVSKIFDLIFDVVEEMQGNLQVIITDHADLGNNDRFQQGVVERWRGGQKLIPDDWP